MLYTLSQWWPLIPVAIFAWYWLTAVKVKELAFQAAARRCNMENVQLLDDSIALKGIEFQRAGNGNMGLRREFAFEFTSTGNHRYQGWVIMQGSRNVSVELPPHRLQ
ncbi:DUF3301 domain-containing protein [uncultured Pseudoteredinibacter sp.]|uniref:DUF3301 domain-containing protein n=1 Tax=uncultured Pseudoteredinibacter sp. TaxID=1641701 RepID=UPI00260506A4|nr:DUF3301 domain-containing protein [uncultured Pseudoteredinibacter sp.]